MSDHVDVMERPDPEAAHFEAIARLNKDLIAAAKTLGKSEARYLVDTYYTVQELRKAAGNRIRAMSESGEPLTFLLWYFEQANQLEGQIKRALNIYSNNDPVGQWARSITGIGPVIAAGLLAYIDIHQAPTVSHIWSFAGYNPDRKWMSRKDAQAVITKVTGHAYKAKGKLSEEELAQVCQQVGIHPNHIHNKLDEGEQPTMRRVAEIVAIRPWSAGLKTLCWKIGDSFAKNSGRPSDVYGKVYVWRKQQEIARNLRGEYADQCREKLESFNWDKTTQAYAWYAGRVTRQAAEGFWAKRKENPQAQPKLVAEGEGQPMLPPAHLDRRAKRHATKLFLAHYHHVCYKLTFGEDPVAPYPIFHLGHADYIPPPNF